MKTEDNNNSDKKQRFRQHLDQWTMVFKQSPRVIHLAWKAWPLGIILVPIVTIILGTLPAFSLYFLKKIIDGVILWTTENPAAGKQMVFLFLSLEVGALLLLHGLDSLNQFLQKVLEARLRFHIQSSIMEKATELDISFFDTPSFYDKLQRAQREVDSRPVLIILSLVHGVKQFITLIGFLAVISSLAVWLIPVLLIASLPALLVQARYGRQKWILVSGRTPEERQMSYFKSLLTSNQDVKEIRLFGLGQHITAQWKKLFWKFYHQDIKLSKSRHLAEFGVLVLDTLIVAGFYVYVIYSTVNFPQVTIGSLIMYTQAMERATNSISVIMQSCGEFFANNLFLSNLFEFLSEKSQIIIPANPKHLPKPIQKGICFDGVSFRYPGASEDIIKNISFEIPAGSRIAIVGENGAGKTTLIKLLTRLYDPQHGQISVDGIDLKSLDVTEWQQNIGVIFQDYVRYCVTARENIGFGDLTNLDNLSRIYAAAEMSGARKPIEKLNNKWDTMLGRIFEDGQELSVGEWQKVALARAFFRESPILILDEPTASLDPKQEYEIFRQFNELTAGKTTILISHRFSSVRIAEHILVLEDGRIVEQGSHEELIALNNRYAELFNRQAAAYR